MTNIEKLLKKIDTLREASTDAVLVASDEASSHFEVTRGDGGKPYFVAEFTNQGDTELFAFMHNNAKTIGEIIREAVVALKEIEAMGEWRATYALVKINKLAFQGVLELEE